MQSSHAHLSGNGCPKCCGFNRTFTEFVNSANIIHNFKYSYISKTYYNAKKKMDIKCKEHGIFKQAPGVHLQKIGCPQCGFNSISKTKTSNTKEFITKAIIIHKNEFIYDNVNYLTSRQKVEIICKKHGSFWQSPNKHLMGRKCPKCKRSSGELKIIKTLESLPIEFDEQIRITLCKNKYPLPFDIGIIKNNKIIGLIEYQGKQHYEPIFQKYFESTKKNDYIKYNYCNINNIPLLIIPYWNKENIDNLVKSFISNLQP